MLELQNLTKVYKTKSEEVVALNHINLNFGETGMVFVIGKSGSGKTTLLNVLGGLDSFDDGDVIIKGKSFRKFKQDDFDNYRNTFVGFVFQEYNLLDEMSVEKNISLAMELQGHNKKDVARINEILAQVDLEGLNKRFPSELSGGQKQRVAIARALVKNPEIILTDEPTGALDTNSGIQVMNLLKELSRDRLVIIVSHNVDLAKAYADRVIEMRDGGIVSDNTLKRDSDGKLRVKELSDKVIVKRGVKLTDKDFELLNGSLKQSKDVQFVDEDNFYSETETQTESKEYGANDAKFIKGRLGFGNTMKMGFSNFKIKPIRLVVTIILCAIAFSVFGLFDCMTINDDARLITNTLRNSNVPSVVLTTTYVEPNGDEHRFNLSQELVDELNRDTGMTFKGAFRISATRPDELRTVPNISRYYRTNQMSGVIEIADDAELQSLGLKVQKGRLPTAFDEIALPWYYAMCVINYGYQYGEINITEENCKDYEPADLVDEENPLVLTFDRNSYKIVGIIDTGTIDAKYDSILEDYDEAATSLKTEFENYVTNSYCLYGFVKSGFVDNYYFENKTLLQYSNTSYNYDFDFTDNDVQYFYNYDQLIKIDGAVTFIDSKKTKLEGNEILINIQLLESSFEPSITRFKAIATGKKQTDDIELMDKYLAELKTTKTTAEEKLQAARNIVDLLTSPGYNIKPNALLINTTVTKRDITRYESDGSDFLQVDVANSKYQVVGFYTGLALNTNVNTLVLTEGGIANLGINVKQGSYNAVIAPSTKSNAQINKVVNLVAGNGELQYACSNNIITIVTMNKDTLQEMSNLFLIVSGVFAAFALVMMANYIATSITNRRTQIGILRALGTTSFGVLLMFLVQSLIVALVNIGLSVAATYVGCGYLNAFLEGKINVSIPLASFTMRQVWVISGLSLGVAIVASLVPILRLSRKKPIETIRR